MKNVNNLFEKTHKELVKIAKRWLYSSCKCGVVLTEYVTQINEIPDAFGLKSGYTILIECKTSRSDFLADRKKMFRRLPEEGIGDYRFYLCEEGLIKADELPDKWGLLYWNGKEVKKICGMKGNISDKNFRFEKNIKHEYRLLYSALRRIKTRGGLDKIYENNYRKSRDEFNKTLVSKSRQIQEEMFIN